MKKLAIYFSDPEPMGDPFNLTYPYWRIYQEIVHNIELRGIEVYIVRGKDAYLGKGVFSHGWQIRNGVLVPIDNVITVDLIFHRGSQASIPASYDCPIINHPDLERLLGDKVRIAQLFSDLSPKTKAINSYQEFLEVVSEWSFNTEEKIVLKKNFLYGGFGIHIIAAKEVDEFLYEDWTDVLVQEFIDSSVGIPGIIVGVHDIRVTSINGEPVYTFVRIPAPGSLLANVAQGGTEIPLTLDRLPKDLLALVTEVNNRLKQYRPSVIAADFFNSKAGFKLVELNPRPGVCLPELSPQDRQFNDKLVEMLVQALS